MLTRMGSASDTRMKVFVSHARADAGFTDQLGAFLGSNGFTPLTNADDGPEAARAAIHEADALVLVLTPRSVASEACMREVEQALELGKRVVPVLPEPFNGGRAPPELADLNYIYWYSDPSVPNSGFFDGQKRLLAALRTDVGWSRKQGDLLALASRWVMSGRMPDQLLRGPAVEQAIAWRESAPPGARAMEIVEEFILASFEWQSNHANRDAQRVREQAAEREQRKAEARRLKDDKRRERDERALAQRIAEAHVQAHLPPQRTGPRFPTFRATILGVFAAAVLAVIFVPGIPGQVRSMLNEAQAVVASIAPEEEPYSPMQVSAEEFNPGRDLVAGRGGANVRDYPLTTGDLLANVPQGTRLRVNGRLRVQGQWWFRVVMPDERVGFVREDVVRWSEPASTARVVADVQTIEPAVAIAAGRAGANLRTRPQRNGSVLVRLPAGAEMNATGKVRQGEHWWLRVSLTDGRNGFVRDDVITAESRAALDL
jgi:hypothetical protein